MIVDLERRERKTEPFGRARLACAGDVVTVNPTRGCVYACAACHKDQARLAGEGHPRRVALYPHLPEQIADLLAGGRRHAARPRLVLFGTSGEPFADHPDILRTSERLLDVLLGNGLRVRLVTRAVIPQNIVTLLAAHRERVTVGISLPSLDERFAALWEPELPAPRARLDGAVRLAHAGLDVSIRLDPLVPLHNDADGDLRALFAALSFQGLRRVTALYLRLRPGQQRTLLQRLPPGQARFVLHLYGAPPHGPGGDPNQGRRLPVGWRARHYTRIAQLAAGFGLRVAICGCNNRDLGSTPGLRGRFVCADQPSDITADGPQTEELPLFAAASRSRSRLAASPVAGPERGPNGSAPRRGR